MQPLSLATNTLSSKTSYEKRRQPIAARPTIHSWWSCRVPPPGPKGNRSPVYKFRLSCCFYASTLSKTVTNKHSRKYLLSNQSRYKLWYCPTKSLTHSCAQQKSAQNMATYYLGNCRKSGLLWHQRCSKRLCFFCKVCIY